MSHAPRPRLAVAAVLMTAVLPIAARAQNGGGGRRGGGAGLAGAVEMRQAVDAMALPADTKEKVNGILQDAAAQGRQLARDLRDAAPEDRKPKQQDLQKLAVDTKAKVLAELTPEQKADLSHRVAVLSVARAGTQLAAERKAADALDAPAEQKTQADNVLDDAAKTVDGYKADADAVKDDPAGTALAQKSTKAVQEANKSLSDIFGADDARKVTRAGNQAVRPADGGGRRRKAAAAATEPAAN